MKPRLMLMLLAAALASACGGGDGYGGSARPPAPQPPASQAPSPVQPTNFNQYVKTAIAETSDASDPGEVNDKEWAFDEREDAFDDVLGIGA